MTFVLLFICQTIENLGIITSWVVLPEHVCECLDEARTNALLHFCQSLIIAFPEQHYSPSLVHLTNTTLLYEIYYTYIYIYSIDNLNFTVELYLCQNTYILSGFFT